MREELKAINNVRATFQGTVVRFGTKPAFKGAPIKTVLIRDVKDKHGTIMTDHLWFVVGIQFEKLNLIPGDVIGFDARVSKYRKGYRGRRDDDDYYDNRPPPSIDYRLSHPTKVRKISSGPAPPITTEVEPRQMPVPRPLPRPVCHCTGWPGPREESGHSIYCRRRQGQSQQSESVSR